MPTQWIPCASKSSEGHGQADYVLVHVNTGQARQRACQFTAGVCLRFARAGIMVSRVPCPGTYTDDVTVS